MVYGCKDCLATHHAYVPAGTFACHSITLLSAASLGRPSVINRNRVGQTAKSNAGIAWLKIGGEEVRVAAVSACVDVE